MQPYRRKLRKNMTAAETSLWEMIRRKQLNGVRFLRQYSVENFILDFYSPKYKLAIELDDEVHNEKYQQERDENRTKRLNELEITVLRFENFEVFDYPMRTLTEIREYIEKIKENRNTDKKYETK
ncbi:MAG: endonuclease domain-containing protein [Bacteroidia bacterium]|nr:endonuclease domain-containing protein [Bacteroidia bacterium]